MRQNQSITGSFDWILFLLVLVLMAMGLTTVYSTAYDPEHPSIFDMSMVYGKQVMWICVALFLGILVFLIDSDIYRKFAVPIYVFSLSLLVVVLFMPPINGARAWLGFGSMGIQPAEFAKIGTAILLARFLGTIGQNTQSIGSLLIANGILMAPMILIILQPDAGTFIVFSAFLFVMYREGVSYDPIVVPITNFLLYLLHRVSFKSVPRFRFKQTWLGTHFIPILFVVIFLSVVALIMHENLSLLILGLALVWIAAFVIMRLAFAKRDKNRAIIIAAIGFVLSAGLTASVNTVFENFADHQKERIQLLLGTISEEKLEDAKDGADYNRNRALAAVGSGGLTGKGYLNGALANTRSNHVPESETDFIFCPFAEEWGFAGSFVLVVLYLFMMLRIVIIAERQRAVFNRVYAYSVAMILFYHFAVNIGMNIEFAPVIGIPLPFFSYGGSSMMSFSIMMFILLKLDSQRKDVLN